MAFLALDDSRTYQKAVLMGVMEEMGVASLFEQLITLIPYPNLDIRENLRQKMEKEVEAIIRLAQMVRTLL